MVLQQILNLLFQVDSTKVVLAIAAPINVNSQIQYLVKHYLLSVLSFRHISRYNTLDTAENKANKLAAFLL